MASLAQINVAFRANQQQFSTELQNVKRMVEKAGKDMQEVGKKMSLALSVPLAAMGAAAIKYGSDYEESVNKVDVAFKGASDQVKAFSKNSLEAFGIAEGSALDMAALFGDMATSMGLPTDKAADLSTSLVGLAGDLASFKNIGIDQATTALNGVFTGETESLKMLGIVMTEANLQQFAYSKGIRTKIKDMTQAQKVELRYAYVMAQTTNAQGDFARTGGGAANQMRIFQESLKQLGAQFGQVILPAFTKVITQVNSMIKRFSGLSDTSKTVIVAVAGITAAIGPLLYAVGTVTAMVPKMAAGFETVKTAMKSFSTFIAANPLTAIAAGIALVVAGFVAYNRAADTTVSKAKLLDEINQNAAKSIAKEVTEMDTLVKIAKDENRSKSERISAIEKINRISPEMLGNISLENINTDKTTKAIEAYNAMLEKKAFQQSIATKKQELYNQKVEKEMQNLTAGGSSQSIFDWISADLLGFEQNLIRNEKELEAYIKKINLTGESAASLREHYAKLIAIRKSETDAIQKQIAALDEMASADADQITGQEGTAAAVKKTIEYYEKLITEQKEIQNTVAESNSAFANAQTKIDAYQKAIDKISGKRQTLEAVNVSGFKTEELAGSIDDFQKQISRLEEEKNRFGVTALQAEMYAAKISALKIKIDLLEGDPFATTAKEMEDWEAKMLKMKETTENAAQQLREKATMIAEAFSTAFEGLGGRITEALGLAATGMQGFLKVLLETTVKLISMMLAQSIATSVANATKSAAATGPAAIFTQPAFIATAIAGVLSAFAAIPKFETGGVVGGNSYYGDKILARLNSGELVLNKPQQKNLMDLIEPAGTNVNIVLDGAFKINGSDLELILDRVAKRNNRIK
ncbi:hypothetical protein ASG38_14975 [Flavobacterium sp. Leaf359]|uniref:hypothetical protein n=1 Tax=Flavobacterium sp. Leaf359 TaxID=1736351 RepID=UPI0007017E28|nr:hypothetical protein [Flavobacterium sp. Leaf359]KQS45910.1 hypothetical protein ASG38_14975 [Flavobacterium sp. Leaf359]